MYRLPSQDNILAKMHNMVEERDELTHTPYAYFPSKCGCNIDRYMTFVTCSHHLQPFLLDGGLVSYDDEQSVCVKTEYMIENNLNGFLIWELSGDLLPDLSTPLLDSINAKVWF